MKPKKVILEILSFGILFISLYVLGRAIHVTSEKNFVNEKYVILEKGQSFSDQYFLIKKLNRTDTIRSNGYLVLLTRMRYDTLYTVLNPSNFLYQHNKQWDQLFYSKNPGDTILIEKIKKEKFWTKLK